MFDISSLGTLRKGRTRLFTGENVYGEKGKGGMARQSSEPQEEVVRMGQLWTGPSEFARDLGAPWKIRPAIFLAPGEETRIVDISGPGRFTHMWCTCNYLHFRDLILRIYWDGEEEPSVESPLGDFFCCGFARPLKILSLPMNANPTGGMNCFLPMPFRGHAKVTIENRSPERVEFFYAISMEEGEVDPREAYFHAKFRRSNPLPYKENYLIIDGIEGEGHYVGTQMGWQQNSSRWWGEGEFKAFIDGDGEFPSYCHTGTEDYFGGAWCFKENYSAPFMGYQDLMYGGEYGEKRPPNSVGNRHSMYRFHITDPIRFTKDFRALMQAIGWRSERRFMALQDDISSVAYWYQGEPHRPFEPLGSRDDLEVI
ncbi:MAG: DUF2961 domain-containing protein [Treponema sp.]|nr:DUF2961 domain-containing protein [Treponema sp.]